MTCPASITPVFLWNIFISLKSNVQPSMPRGPGDGFQLVWACERAHVNPCMSVLVFWCDKSPMWATDSPGVSMMSRRKPFPSRGWQVGIPFAHGLQWVTLHPFSSQQPFSLLLWESYSSVNLLSWILSIRISCSHQTGRFQARGNFFFFFLKSPQTQLSLQRPYQLLTLTFRKLPMKSRLR